MTAKGFFFIWILLFVLAYTNYAKDVRRVVSLAPSVTEIIYLIGAEDKLVGCTSYCSVAENDDVAEVGNAVDVNIEALFALQPDVVLAMKLTKAQDIAAMEKLGIKVEVMDSPRSFDEICDQTLHIASLIGNKREAGEVVEAARKKVKEIENLSSELKHRKIFFQLGANPVFTVLENTFMNDYLSICNAENIAAGLSKGTISRESVLLRNPDVIIIATMGGFGEEEMKIWRTFDTITAVKNNDLFLIDSKTSCSPTPANFVSALEDVYGFLSKRNDR